MRSPCVSSASALLGAHADPPPGRWHSVAATNTPIIFIGTGEHLHDLEKFSPQPFISKMLGMGDMQGLVERAQEMALANPERQEKMMKKLEKGEFTVRDLKDQLATVMGMCVAGSFLRSSRSTAFELLTGECRAYAYRGPLSNLASMIPGMSEMMGGGGEEDVSRRMKRVAFIFDSMTTEELDSDGSLFRDSVPSAKGKEKEKDEEKDPSNPMGLREPNKRVLRVARGSGTSVQEVEELLAQHQMFAKMAKRMGGKNGLCVAPSSSKLLASQNISPDILDARRMGKLAARGGAGGRPGGMPGLGGAGMPPLGPGGMPDLSKLSPSQMRAMQVRPSLSLSRSTARLTELATRSLAVDAPARRARDDVPPRRDGGDAEDDVWRRRTRRTRQLDGRDGRRDGRHAQRHDGRSMRYLCAVVIASCALVHSKRMDSRKARR